MVLDTELTDALRAEGDARELARAIQDLRRDAGLELDDRIELWVDGLPEPWPRHLPAVADDTLADLRDGRPAGRRPSGDGRAGRAGRSRSPCGRVA